MNDATTAGVMVSDKVHKAQLKLDRVKVAEEFDVLAAKSRESIEKAVLEVGAAKLRVIGKREVLSNLLANKRDELAKISEQIKALTEQDKAPKE